MPLIAYGALAAFQMMAGNQNAAAIRQQADFKQQIDNINAGYADLDARNALVQGYTQADRYGAVIDKTIGQQRVGYASENVDVNFGTAAAVQGETKLTGLLNVLDIQQQARQRSLGFTREASNLRMGGNMSVVQGALDAAGAETQGNMGALRTGVTGYDRYTTPDRGKTLPTSEARMVAAGDTSAFGDTSSDWRTG